MFRKSRVYLDWAAAAPIHPHARAAFVAALTAFGNPSSPHSEGRAAHDVLENAREKIARLAQVKPEAVIFTSGATEANALAIEGYIRARKEKEMHVLYLPTAHSSVFHLMDRLAQKGVATEKIALMDGEVDFEKFKNQIKPSTVLVSIEVIGSETGARVNVRKIREILDDARKDGGERIILHIDASQVPLVESIERLRFGADLMTLDAAKVGGVRGIGALIAPVSISLAPIIEGGGQERGLRSGTESPALASAFATALRCADKERDAFVKRARSARIALVQNILAFAPSALINEGKENAPHILNVSFPGIDTDYLVALLDEAGFAVSTRSACETDAEGSRVILAQSGDTARAAATLRISWGPSTKENDIRRFATALKASLAFIEKNRLKL